MQNNTKYILIGVFGSIILLSGFFLSTKYFFVSEVNNGNKATTTKISLNDTYTNQIGKEDGTIYKNINDEIANYKKDIQENANTDNKVTLISKKIYYYRALGSSGVGVNTKDGGKTEFLTSMNGFYDTYQDIEKLPENEKKNRDLLRLYLFKKVFDTFGSSPFGATVASTSWSQESDYKLFHDKYPKDPKLIFRIYLDRWFTKNNIRSDKMLAGIEMYNAAVILNIYKGLIKADYKDYLINKLHNLNNDFINGKDSKIFTNLKIDRQVIPLTYYLASIEILSINDSSFDSKTVSQTYKDFSSLVKTTASGTDDFVNVEQMKADINYLEFVFFKNNYKSNKEFYDLIKQIENFPIIYKGNNTFLYFYISTIKQRMQNDRLFGKILIAAPEFNTYLKKNIQEYEVK